MMGVEDVVSGWVGRRMESFTFCWSCGLRLLVVVYLSSLMRIYGYGRMLYRRRVGDGAMHCRCAMSSLKFPIVIPIKDTRNESHS